jgi:superfamily II DNA/RNA helicase
MINVSRRIDVEEILPQVLYLCPSRLLAEQLYEVNYCFCFHCGH